MPSRHHFRISAGEDRTLSLTARGAGGAILDLTTYSISWSMAHTKGGAPVLQKTGTVVSAVAGTFTISLTDSDTNLLKAGTYFHQALATAGATTLNVAEGNIQVSLENTGVLSSSLGAVYNNNQFYGSRAEAVLTKISANPSFLETFGYYAVGDGGGAKYKRIGAVPSHAGYFQSADGAYWELIVDNEVNVKHFGAKGDGSTDDATAINDALDWLRVNIRETNPANNAQAASSWFVVLPATAYGYLVASGIDATGLRQRDWGIKGPGRILAAMNSGAVLDLTFSRFAHLSDLKIVAATGYTPAIGILLARESTGAVADVHYLENVHIYGSFTTACLYNYGAEDTSLIACAFYNTSTSSSSYVVYLDGSNRLGVTSAFQTIPSATPVSFNDFHALRGDFRKDGGPVIYMRKTDGFHFSDCYFAGDDDTIFVIHTTSTDFNRNVTIDGHLETTGLLRCIRFEGDATQSLYGFNFIDYNPLVSDEIFKAGTGVTSVTLIGPHIEIANINNGAVPTNGVFNGASVFKFTKPDIRVYCNGATVLELWDGVTIDTSGVAASHTGNTTETVLATVPLYANIMGANGTLIVTSYWTFTNSGNNKILTVRVGTSGNGLTGSIWGQTTQTTTRSMRMQNEIHNRNSVSSQVLMNGIGTGGWGTTVNAASTDTRDTTVAQDLVFTATLANSGESIQLESYTVELKLP